MLLVHCLSAVKQKLFYASFEVDFIKVESISFSTSTQPFGSKSLFLLDKNAHKMFEE